MTEKKAAQKKEKAETDAAAAEGREQKGTAEEATAKEAALAQAEKDKAEAVKIAERQYVPEQAPQAVAAAGPDGQEVPAGEGDIYLNSGAHIGTRFKSGDMRRYIYKVRKDGLKVLDVKTLDDRLKLAAKMISHYPKERIIVVARRAYGQTPAKAFAEAVGGTAVVARFVPGTFTNPESTHFVEPAIVIAVDPEVDNQAIEEATNIRVPVIGMASTNNSLKNIDLAIPINNKGKKSLALGFWMLAKETLKERGDIKADDEFTKKAEDFEYKLKEGEEEEQRRSFERRQRGKDDRFGRFGDRGGGFRRFGGDRGGSSFGGFRRREN
ncbi:30S ribosomal protein S2 [uncultured archaeon]|nr:30S ribosomal protein S2 [uncultured archaeon]